MSEADFWADIRREIEATDRSQRHSLVFLHGYNVSFEEAAIRAAQIGFDLKISGAVAFFSWPSQGSLLGYAADEATIEASEAAIADFLCNFRLPRRAMSACIFSRTAWQIEACSGRFNGIMSEVANRSQ